MKEIYESYQEKLQPYTDNDLTGFSESIVFNEAGSHLEHMLRSAGHSFTQTRREHDHKPVLPVNNYLKTAEEIEVEFLYMMNTCKAKPDEKENIWQTYDLLTRKNTEPAATIHRPHNVLFGSMEENY